MITAISETVVIGCGVMGASIAYHLAKRGLHVHMIERAQIAASPAASWASAGGVRRQVAGSGRGSLRGSWPAQAEATKSERQHISKE